MVIRLLAAFAALFMSVATATPAAQPQPFIPLLETGDAIPAFPLVAQDGRAFDLASLRGNAVIVSFIYTRCADARMCPLVSAKFARVQHAIGAAPIRLLEITLDPAYDTPAVLHRYGAAFGADPRRWTLATGSAATIDDVAGRLGIATSSTVPGTIVHTEAAAIIGPDGRLARTIDGNAWTPDDLIDSARATLPGQTDPFVGPRTWLGATLERCGGGSLALGGAEMLGVFGLALLGSGYVFWNMFAVRRKASGVLKH